MSVDFLQEGLEGSWLHLSLDSHHIAYSRNMGGILSAYSFRLEIQNGHVSADGHVPVLLLAFIASQASPQTIVFYFTSLSASLNSAVPALARSS